MTRCAVLGRPVAHSLSPALHRAAYAASGLDWSYDAIDVSAGELPGFLGSLGPEWRGLSLTMPLKRAVVPLLDDLSGRAAEAGAANTVLLERGRAVGHNTDIPGAVAALRERYAGPVQRAIVVGGGATAASMLLALADLGCGEVDLVVRDASRAGDTLAAVARHRSPPVVRVVQGAAASTGADILVSAVPGSAQSDWLLALAAGPPVVFDVAYDPWPTRLLAESVRSGKTVVSGVDLLTHQAALQFCLMAGRDQAPIAVMRAAAEAEIGRASSASAPPPAPDADHA